MINAAHWHVLLNHIPIVGVPMVAILLAWGLARANDAMIRLALIAAVVMAGSAWLANTTGGKAEDGLKDAKVTWLSEDRIHEHEEAGEKAEIAAIITGVLALGTLVLARGGKSPNRKAALGVLLGLGASAVLLAWTGWEGGKIRHDEFGVAANGAVAPAKADKDD